MGQPGKSHFKIFRKRWVLGFLNLKILKDLVLGTWCFDLRWLIFILDRSPPALEPEMTSTIWQSCGICCFTLSSSIISRSISDLFTSWYSGFSPSSYVKLASSDPNRLIEFSVRGFCMQLECAVGLLKCWDMSWLTVSLPSFWLADWGVVVWMNCDSRFFNCPFKSSLSDSKVWGCGFFYFIMFYRILFNWSLELAGISIGVWASDFNPTTT